jgi:nucleotide-binding universal stress UspA family protein
MLVTVLDVANGSGNGKKKAKDDDSAAKEPLRDVAKSVVTAAGEAGAKGKDIPKVDVIVRKHDVAPEEAIATEARRGYDLLVVGVDDTAAKGGGFHATLSNLVRNFTGSLAVVVARGAHETDPMAAIKKVLVPVTGNENARRGAEVAITLAHAAHAPAATLSIISRSGKNRRQSRRETEAVADEIKRVASYLQTKIKSSIRTDDDPGDAILKAIPREGADMVAIGVSRRPGDQLSFGGVADALLKDAKCSLIFIAPQTRGAVRSAAKGPEQAAAG